MTSHDDQRGSRRDVPTAVKPKLHVPVREGWEMTWPVIWASRPDLKPSRHYLSLPA